MEEDGENEPSGPVVVLARDGEAYTAYVDPPLPSGDHRVSAQTKDGGWQAARELWKRFRLGLRDESNPNIGRFLDRE